MFVLTQYKKIVNLNRYDYTYVVERKKEQKWEVKASREKSLTTYNPQVTLATYDSAEKAWELVDRIFANLTLSKRAMDVSEDK